MQIHKIIEVLEAFAPLDLQEDYDNSGLLCGDVNEELRGTIISIDCTEDVINEAIEKGCNLVISHHPILFGSLKRLTGRDYVEKTLIKAIKHNISIYAIHTNLDNVLNGVNAKIANKLGLTNVEILVPKANELRKLVTFCPISTTEKVRMAIFNTGGGQIGKYDQCSFNVKGVGTFRAGDDTKPFVGEKGKLHEEEEQRIELIYKKRDEAKIIKALLNAHPYEEVAFDIYPLINKSRDVGSGMIGYLDDEMDTMVFLKKVKDIFNVSSLKYTNPTKQKVKKIAICGGSGSFLIPNAISQNADIFLTADIKYHQFFDANDKITLVDIGHFESEQFTTELISEILIEKFPTFAFHFSEVKTNPVNYL